ncbi:MAG TPA: sulfotransferase [Devosia sp.]|nr:sulfotransferase [Devosia sp.]
MRVSRDEALGRAGALLRVGDLAGVAQIATQLLSADPRDVKALHLAGIVAMNARRYGAAHQYLSRAVALNPRDATLQSDLGLTFLKANLPDQAEIALSRALALKPDLAAAQINLASTLARLGRFAEGVPLARKAITSQPTSPDALLALGAALSGLDEIEETIAAYRQAVSLAPNRPDLHAELGSALMSMGDIGGSKAAFLEAIRLQPDEGEWWLRLSRLPNAGLDQQALRDRYEAARDPLQRSAMGFALARALDESGDKLAAIEMFIAANGAKRATFTYDDAETEADFVSMEAVFTEEMFRANQDAGSRDVTPIFILGMPRSGTSLVEQILACHPEVFGGGELLAMGSEIHRAAGFPGTAPRLAALVPSLTKSQVTEIGDSYVARLRKLSPNARHITDKLPGNFARIGLIALALPNAKIIHVRRNPADNCVSIFKNEFGSLHTYAYDLTELGKYHRHYQRLMAHWHRVLPGRILDIDYEALVAEPEAESRRLIAHCGLEWSDECLKFFNARRSVRTVSAAQVRRPIYRDSIGIAERYGSALVPLLEALGQGGNA